MRFTGITFATLKALNGNIQKSKGIESTKMKYKASGSMIVVQHGGPTENLLKSLENLSPSIFSEKTIESLEESDISVRIP